MKLRLLRPYLEEARPVRKVASVGSIPYRTALLKRENLGNRPSPMRSRKPSLVCQIISTEVRHIISQATLIDFDGGTQKTYQRMIQEMDRQIGRVLEALHKNGLVENTIVIFTSDNGGERFSDTWPFTGRKTELLEGGLRIPAIISWPARIPQGRTANQVAITMDWMPTLLAAASIPPDPAFPLDGINLLPALAHNTVVERKLFWRYKANAQRAARDGDYKYLKILDNTFLFNVVEDPMERANLKVRRKDVYDRIVAEWYEWNATMLPEMDDSYTANFTGDQLADHIGTQKASGRADNPEAPKMPSAEPD